jgi:hypothetical protein
MMSVVNKSSLCTDAEVKAMVRAIAHRLRLGGRLSKALACERGGQP